MGREKKRKPKSRHTAGFIADAGHIPSDIVTGNR